MTEPRKPTTPAARGTSADAKLPKPPDSAGLVPPAGLATMALETLSDMVVITGVDGRIVYVNPAFTEVTGYSAKEAIGGTPRLLSSGLQDREFYSELWDTVLRGEIWRGQLVNRRSDGSLYTDEMVITPLRGGDGEDITHFLAVKRAIGKTLGAMADSSPTGIAHLGRDGSLVYANATLERLFNADYQQLVGDGWLLLLDDDDTARVAEYLSLPADDTRDGPMLSLPSGRTGLLRTAPLTGSEGTELGVVVTIEDVTDAVVAADLARHRERFAFAIIDGLADPTLVVDNEGRQIHANAAYERLLAEIGAPVPEPGSTTLWPAGEDAQRITSLLERVLDPAVSDGPDFVELAADHEEGRRWWMVRVAQLDAAMGAVVTWTDISRQKFEELRLSHRAEHDDLTGLARRDAALGWLADALAEGPVGLVYIDLDGFKQVNDVYGHAAGDELLLTISRRLSRSVRTSDLAARIGGDEFLLLIRGADNPAKLDELVARARQSVERPIRLSAATVHVGMSAGIAHAKPGNDPDAVLEDADRRMFVDKRERRVRR